MFRDGENPGRGGSPAVQKDRAVATRAGLVAAARRLFAEAGYHATSTTDIVSRASLTRGALYHHFTDKEALFEAVFLDASADLDRRARAAVASFAGDLLDKMTAAFASHLRLVASSREFQRILVTDGPAVLGWSRWRELQSRFVVPDTRDALRELMRQGVVAHGPAEPLAYLIQAALNDVALSIAHSPDRNVAAQAEEGFLILLNGLRLK